MEKAQTNNDATTNSEIELKVSEDKLTVLLSCKSECARREDLIEDIKNRLTKKNIKAEPNLKHLSSVVDESKTTGKDIVDLIIAKGQSPVMPQDGKLEWTRDYFVEGYQVDAKTHRIDYHEKRADSIVEKGDLLVKVHPPGLGEPGLDVHGATIKVPQPIKATLKAGPNVFFSEEHSGYITSCSGRVELKGTTLDVSEVYHIHGDVGIKTGNIKHNGQVVIDGDVAPNFKIEATGDIEIRGTMDPSDIACGGNLTVNGGINGRHDIEFRVEGNISSRYIIGVNLECLGDIHVEREICQSVIRTEGEVACEGRVVGGVIMAAKGITVGETGAKEDAETTLVAGVSHGALAAIEAGNSRIEILKKQMHEVKAKIRQIRMRVKVLNQPQRKAIMEIESSLMNTQVEIGKLEEENEKHKKLVAANQNAQIKILNQANPGTVLKIVHSQYRIESAMLGPIVASLDKITRKITLSSEMKEEEACS